MVYGFIKFIFLLRKSNMAFKIVMIGIWLGLNPRGIFSVFSGDLLVRILNIID